MVSARVTADREVCVGAGNCVMTAPQVFDQDDDGRVVVLDPDPAVAPEVLERAEQMCPSGAITAAPGPSG
jgi:ferredoxin